MRLHEACKLHFLLTHQLGDIKQLGPEAPDAAVEEKDSGATLKLTFGTQAQLTISKITTLHTDNTTITTVHTNSTTVLVGIILATPLSLLND